jgi:hypothetical protein
MEVLGLDGESLGGGEEVTHAAWTQDFITGNANKDRMT